MPVEPEQVGMIDQLAPYDEAEESASEESPQAGKELGPSPGGCRRFHKEAIDRWLDRQASENRG